MSGAPYHRAHVPKAVTGSLIGAATPAEPVIRAVPRTPPAMPVLFSASESETNRELELRESQGVSRAGIPALEKAGVDSPVGPDDAGRAQPEGECHDQ